MNGKRIATGCNNCASMADIASDDAVDAGAGDAGDVVHGEGGLWGNAGKCREMGEMKGNVDGH